MRYHVLISYDISDPKRLRRVHRLVRGYGDPVQYSVYMGQLSAKDEAVMREKLRDIIHHKEDQIVLVRLGEVGGESKASPDNWTVLGRSVYMRELSVMVY